MKNAVGRNSNNTIEFLKKFNVKAGIRSPAFRKNMTESDHRKAQVNDINSPFAGICSNISITDKRLIFPAATDF